MIVNHTAEVTRDTVDHVTVGMMKMSSLAGHAVHPVVVKVRVITSSVHMSESVA